ncbi:CaiB/BaiF CoA-transferase family protein [Zhongshania sp.]|jgi:crotonobetainyl-CoA:carnitine CoA-transferase CaiB-like acyl-CoA transferase|uniref:CaiB/BaiF CoA transferase family protein n=1 Tax=Zhongshania sp. TaxID=1971902 RepID=UPI001B6125BA|nr:CaiB/BaiF CoA-transferase family protein [Zhongshania sp.]MBQ0796477.1 CoA transferase [Zhongshania sp.]
MVDTAASLNNETSNQGVSNRGPLQGIRILELGQLIAGPFTSTMLAYFGAEVIKIEPPGIGDPIRRWRSMKGDTSLWWYSIGRNKKSVTVDLRHPEGQVLVRDLAAQCDVLIENFRPGVMEDWGLGPEDLKAANPALVYTRISGYGQTGPNAEKPGFASVCEGFSGFRHLNGFPGEAPVRPNLSLGDSIASLHAIIGILMALNARDRGIHKGQVVDVALYETMFNMLESLVPEYAEEGIIREASGTTLTGIVPTNTYRCLDDKFVIIGGNGDSIFKRLMTEIGRKDFADDPAMADNAGRVIHQQKIDDAISQWCLGHPIKSVIEKLEAVRVPAGPIYNAEDMANDPHFQARGLFEKVSLEDSSTITIPGMSPKLVGTPGGTQWAGPKLGQHTEEVLTELLDMTAERLASLKNNAVI